MQAYYYRALERLVQDVIVNETLGERMKCKSEGVRLIVAISMRRDTSLLRSDCDGMTSRPSTLCSCLRTECLSYQ